MEYRNQERCTPSSKGVIQLTKTDSSATLNSIVGNEPIVPTNQVLPDNFKTLIDKIIKSNDQPASITLQQRLRNDNETTKSLVIDSILPNILALTKNRFGNFLVQVALECGNL